MRQPQGLASPIKGLAAAADPTVRAGTSGLFYYSRHRVQSRRRRSRQGVRRPLHRQQQQGRRRPHRIRSASVRLMSARRGSSSTSRGSSPTCRAAASTCMVNGRSVPAGPVYLVYTSFLGSDNNVHSKILFSKSDRLRRDLVEPVEAERARGEEPGHDHRGRSGHRRNPRRVARVRRRRRRSSRNAILVRALAPTAASRSPRRRRSTRRLPFSPFDQASSVLTFRTNAYPTIAVVPAEAEGRAAGQPGRVYVAWSARGFGGARAERRAHRACRTSIGGNDWTAPRMADSFAGAGHQIMPALAFAGGKVALAYYDLRDDASGGFEDLVFEYGHARLRGLPGADGRAAYVPFSRDLLVHADASGRPEPASHAGHARGDGRRRSASPPAPARSRAPRCSAAAARCRATPKAAARSNGPRVQLQYNRPNLPIFSKGQLPVHRRLHRHRRPELRRQRERHAGRGTRGRPRNRPAPVFHVAWADNRNVGTPRDTTGRTSRRRCSARRRCMCVAGSGRHPQPGRLHRAAAAGAGGVGAAELEAHRRTAALVRRRRAEHDRRRTRLRAARGAAGRRDCLVRPVQRLRRARRRRRSDPAGDGDRRPHPAQVERVAHGVRRPRESAGGSRRGARTCSCRSTVDAVRPTRHAGAAFDIVYLNPDFENPDFENPDFENTELHNPDFENPDFENPDFENPDFENFTLSASSSIRNPDFENPDFENPDFENPDFENPGLREPRLRESRFRESRFREPRFREPRFREPRLREPGLRERQLPGGRHHLAGAQQRQHHVGLQDQRLRQRSAGRRALPAGGAEDLHEPRGRLRRARQHRGAAHARRACRWSTSSDPNVQTNPFDRNFNDPSRDNATFSLAPGERGLITLRAYCAGRRYQLHARPAGVSEGSVALGVVAQGANCATCTGAACTLGDFVERPHRMQHRRRAAEGHLRSDSARSGGGEPDADVPGDDVRGHRRGQHAASSPWPSRSSVDRQRGGRGT